MRLATPIAAAALLMPTAPLFATPGLECASRQRGAPSLYLSVGSGGGVDLVLITDRRGEVRVTGLPGANPRIARGFMDDSGQLSVRIVGADGRTPVASLDLPGGRPARAGTFRYRGRAWLVSCRWESQE